MSLQILAGGSPGEVRVAVLLDAEMVDFAIWRPGAPDGVGDVSRGRVIARVPAMAGTFVAFDGGDGFLPDSEGGDGLSQGDPVAVRVTRAGQGGKGPRLMAVPADTPPRRGPGALLELTERFPDAPVLTDDAALAARLWPVLADRLKVVPGPFIELEEYAEALARPVVELVGGMRLRIDPTPALVAIDIDLGGEVASGVVKNAAHFALNKAALPALAQQIRLRNLSGAIMVDFAGLPARRRRSLGPWLSAALAGDPLRPRLLGFTNLGLAEIVRPRVHPPLHELLTGPHCSGLAALRQIAREFAAQPHSVPMLRASPAVVAALQADPVALSDLAERTGRALIMRSDPSLQAAGWVLEHQYA